MPKGRCDGNCFSKCWKENGRCPYIFGWICPSRVTREELEEKSPVLETT